MPGIRTLSIVLVCAALAGCAGGLTSRSAPPRLPSSASSSYPFSAPAIDIAPQAAGEEIVLRSLALIGVPYRLGGNSPDTGLDCSGLVRHVYDEVFGFALPRRSEEMSRAGAPVSVDRLQPGDLVFFNTLRRAFSHVGIYIGENRFVHAPSTGGRVRVESIDVRYWARRFDGARRIAVGSDIANSSRLD